MKWVPNKARYLVCMDRGGELLLRVDHVLPIGKPCAGRTAEVSIQEPDTKVPTREQQGQLPLSDELITMVGDVANAFAPTACQTKTREEAMLILWNGTRASLTLGLRNAQVRPEGDIYVRQGEDKDELMSEMSRMLCEWS